MKVLVIEDAIDVVKVVSLCLELRWPDATILSAAEGSKGLELIEKEKPDLVILDLGLPDMDGLDVLREIRRFSDVPIIVLTVRDRDSDIARGLELGADDYMTKPFSHIELQARVNTVLRRAQGAVTANNEGEFNSGNLSINFASREVYLDGQRVRLTPIEYNLLYYLVRNAGRVVTHRALLNKVWGPEYTDDSTDTIKVHIQHLRRKLKDNPESPSLILTERGIGYRFVNPS